MFKLKRPFSLFETNYCDVIYQTLKATKFYSDLVQSFTNRIQAASSIRHKKLLPRGSGGSKKVVVAHMHACLHIHTQARMHGHTHTLEKWLNQSPSDRRPVIFNETINHAKHPDHITAVDTQTRLSLDRPAKRVWSKRCVHLVLYNHKPLNHNAALLLFEFNKRTYFSWVGRCMYAYCFINQVPMWTDPVSMYQYPLCSSSPTCPRPRVIVTSSSWCRCTL